MHTVTAGERGWHPKCWRLFSLNALHVVLATLLVQPLIALARGRPGFGHEAFATLALFLLAGALLALYQYRSRRFVLRATDTVLCYPWRSGGRHTSVRHVGLLASPVSRAMRGARLLLTLRIAHADGTYLSLRPFLYSPVEREGLGAFVAAGAPAAQPRVGPDALPSPGNPDVRARDGSEPS